MTFIPWPSGAQVALHWTGTAYTWANLLAVSKPGFGTADQLTLANLIGTEYRTSLKAMVDASVHLNDVLVTDMRTQGAPAIQSTFGALAGTGSGTMIPPNNAVVITLRTALRGRAYRGRNYFTGFMDSFTNDTGLLAALTDEVVDQYEAWQAAMTSLGWTLCVASRQFNHVVRSEAVLQPVTSILCRELQVGSQRRRVRRR